MSGIFALNPSINGGLIQYKLESIITLDSKCVVLNESTVVYVYSSE